MQRGAGFPCQVPDPIPLFVHEIFGIHFYIEPGLDLWLCAGLGFDLAAETLDLRAASAGDRRNNRVETAAGGGKEEGDG